MNSCISSAMRMIYRTYKRSEQICSAWSGRQKAVVSIMLKEEHLIYTHKTASAKHICTAGLRCNVRDDWGNCRWLASLLEQGHTHPLKRSKPEMVCWLCNNLTLLLSIGQMKQNLNYLQVHFQTCLCTPKSKEAPSLAWHDNKTVREQM